MTTSKFSELSMNMLLISMHNLNGALKYFFLRHVIINNLLSLSQLLRKNCPNTEFFSGPYFPALGLNTG